MCAGTTGRARACGTRPNPISPRLSHPTNHTFRIQNAQKQEILKVVESAQSMPGLASALVQARVRPCTCVRALAIYFSYTSHLPPLHTLTNPNPTPHKPNTNTNTYPQKAFDCSGDPARVSPWQLSRAELSPAKKKALHPYVPSFVYVLCGLCIASVGFV